MDDEDRSQPWWLLHGNMVKLLEYLSDEPAYSKADMVYALEKPWKYAPEFERATKEVQS